MLVFRFILFLIGVQNWFAAYYYTFSSILCCVLLIIIIYLLFKTIYLKKRTTFLRKEMHHRVKNNIQLVSSLINLQLRHSIDHKVLAELKDSKSRFATLGIVNKIIFQTEIENKKVNINSLTNSIVEKNINQNNLASENLHNLFCINAKLIEIDVEKAIPLGLIINELLLFSIKNKLYLSGKEIAINLDYCLDSDMYKFKFVNNHAPVNWNANFDNTLSEKIIVRLTNQLQSEMKIDYNEKMEFSFSF